MKLPHTLTVQQIQELVMANKIIRSPYYNSDKPAGKGRRWGEDIIPALLGLFRVERDTRDDHPNGWVGFARHWNGEIFRLELDLKSSSEGVDQILVLTAVSGLEKKLNTQIIIDH